MKARVKATGEIVDGSAMVSFQGDDFYLDELEIIQDEPDKTLYDELDDVYWANMEHQYAGMAMQGLMSNIEQITPKEGRSFCDEIVGISFKVAHALVEKMKEERK